ncbi:ornithine carbamoyltransferase [Helicoverpa armigera]|nr:ornithine carbamoyltransferase [Helicoverpa armigera]
MTINFRAHSLDLHKTTTCLKTLIKQPFFKRSVSDTIEFTRVFPPRHLICFKQWNAKMVLEILLSAMNLKCRMRDTHNKKLDVLPNTKVMILSEVNEPMLNMAVSKAASLLGANDVNIVDQVVWEHDYNGKIFSDMADIIFVSTKTHMCIQRFADKSSVPVLCMMSRTHASIQSLSTVMSIMEEYGSMQGVNLSYVGPPHPVLNSYLLLCPMLGANIRFKCGCNECPVTPLLLDASKAMTAKTATETEQCMHAKEALKNACVVIAGPTASKDKIHEFAMDMQEINKLTAFRWIFFHTCPRGAEVDDLLFWNCNARTFNAFHNMQYIAAALMAAHVRNYRF